MIWSELYGQGNQPTLENVNDFVKDDLLTKLCLYLESNFSVLPKMEYSCCSMQKGWNIKYKKSGKSLCTIYPMNGYFIVLVVISEKERMEADFLIPTCSDYVQKLYSEAAFSNGSKWMMIEVRDNNVLADVIKLIHFRTNKKQIKKMQD